MQFIKYLRKLAKQISSQNIFIAAKEINGIRLFENQTDLSKIQQEYVGYLYFYYNLYQDLYAKKVSEKIFTDELYEDSYSYYKSKHEDKKDKKTGGKERKMQASFAKDNTKIVFPKEVK